MKEQRGQTGSASQLATEATSQPGVQDPVFLMISGDLILMPLIMQMTKGKAITGLSLLLIIVITGLIVWDPWSHYKVNLFKSGSGYGYEILAGHNPYIYQPYMPAVEGQQPFSDRRSARKTENEGRFRHTPPRWPRMHAPRVAATGKWRSALPYDPSDHCLCCTTLQQTAETAPFRIRSLLMA